jgi:chloramphenicol-sensitive protein RarD
MNKGIWSAAAAYVAWGLLPLYWKQLHNLPPTQVISHRVVWSCLILLGCLLAAGQLKGLRAALNWRVLGTYAAAAVLIAVNWLIFLWAVNANYVVETSLGYFITPLISVLLGVVFLRERLRPWQWLPIGLAAAGVLYLTLLYGSLPWIALSLAGSFALYGLVKKTAPLGSFYGLTIETGLLFAPALIYLIVMDVSGQGAFRHSGVAIDLLLVGAGLVTTAPLLLFASAARKIPLSLVGILQYIAPTLQFLLGVLVYHEPFSLAQLWGFAIVWAALVLFAVEGSLAYRRRTALIAAG